MKRLAFSVILALLVVGSVELISAAGTWLLVRQGWMTYIPRFTAGQMATYLGGRDSLLGWGARTNGAGEVTRLAPRADPASSNRGAPCASTYGDSFTYGSEAKDDETYPHQLALALGCRVDNFGVGGYGTDQALMLFRAQARRDSAPVVIIAHAAENVVRNVNQYRQLIYPYRWGEEIHFKPRFLLEAAGLAWVPAPVRERGDFRRVEQNPDSALRLDAFVRRPRRSFPYTVALVRWALTDYQVRARVARRPRWAEFYRRDHPSGALPLAERIIATFAAEAAARGRTPVVVLIPLGQDLDYARRTGRWADQPLADALRDRGLAVVHAGPLMLRVLGGRDPCALFYTCTAHYNPAGYGLLAAVVAAELPRTRLAPTLPVAAREPRR